LTSTQVADATALRPLSLLLIDVDNLDRINRTLGRSVGDEVMGCVVHATRKSLRAADMLFRHGDDEFVALLLHTSQATARTIAVRIQEAVAREQDERDATERFVISISTVSAPQDGQSVDDLLQNAVARQLPNGKRSESGGSFPRSIH
jgi:diguanylate cyclase (GGDEF)-like protein